MSISNYLENILSEVIRCIPINYATEDRREKFPKDLGSSVIKNIFLTTQTVY